MKKMGLWSILVLLITLTAGGVQASSVYGGGTYSGCSVQVDCPPAASSSEPPSATSASTPAPDNTVATTPSGLKFAVNLTDGQLITSRTYDITVTPLNGQGTSFARVAIYLGGSLVATVVPGENGTAIWSWDTSRYPSSNVRVIVYDSTDGATTDDFNIVLKKPAAASSIANRPGGLLGLLPLGVADLVTATSAHTVRLIKEIPVPIARSFPYLLFILLGAGLLVLVIQARDEVAKIEAMKRTIERERLIGEEKATFMQLIQHYLRTPLTLLKGAIDSQSATPQLPQQSADKLKVVVAAIDVTVEKLIQEIEQNKRLSDIPEVGATYSPLRIWATAGFFLPIGLIAVITFTFNYLAVYVGQIDINTTNVIIQVIVLVLLALSLYLLLRGRNMRRMVASDNARILERQETVDAARNEFTESCGQALTPDIEHLKTILPGLGQGNIAHSIRDSYERYQRILSAIAVVSKLKSGQEQSNLSPVTLEALLDKAKSKLGTAGAHKGISINMLADATLLSQQPNWLSFVLTSLLDNAVAYSDDHASIEVSSTSGPISTITVTDHGSGIAADKLTQLFQPFYRAEGALTFTHEGMGFSLFLDKLVMHHLGGDIHAESKPNQGTAISISFRSA